MLHGQGPLLIIAGAGTGKTKVITHRIAHMISSKRARPEEILAVTFTEKAASEMEARVDVLVPYTYSFVEISTFNSFGEKVLRDYALDLGYPPDFKLLDDVEQAIFFRENLFRFSLEYYRPLSYPTRHIQELLDAIRRLKQEDVRPPDYVLYAEELAGRASGEGEKETARKHREVARVYYLRVEVGRKVEAALTEEKDTRKEEILNTLSPLAVDTKVNTPYGELTIINAAFLVENAKEAEFDRNVQAIADKYDDKIKFKYTGTLPPFNFVNLVIETGKY